LPTKRKQLLILQFLMDSSPRAAGGFTYLYRPFKRATPGAATMGRFTSMERMA